jgi:hypothetical protein
MPYCGRSIAQSALGYETSHRLRPEALALSQPIIRDGACLSSMSTYSDSSDLETLRPRFPGLGQTVTGRTKQQANVSDVQNS